MNDWKEVGFERFKELGFEIDRIVLDRDNKTILPAYDADELLERGFTPRGTRVTFLNKHGYDRDRESILGHGIHKGDVLTVKSCTIGDWSAYYTFEEIPGKHNTVMFEVYKNPTT